LTGSDDSNHRMALEQFPDNINLSSPFDHGKILP
jgi:hypothetical protein